MKKRMRNNAYLYKMYSFDAPYPFSRIKITLSRTSSVFHICLSKRHIKMFYQNNDIRNFTWQITCSSLIVNPQRLFFVFILLNKNKHV